MFSTMRLDICLPEKGLWEKNEVLVKGERK